ncbi:MAG: ethanolamine utilization protein EutJ [Archangium gephyra]|uniref:Ethanolamine utilization protein EutJ n=1 Tax=Archangium gephyra TaxID=48 RepID=A0A2W5SVP3_9BACT|nr:MAG: ethanolamine utilization protein EutJ [Archangium gephyra]
MRISLLAALASLSLMAACEKKNPDPVKPPDAAKTDVKAVENKPAEDVILLGEVGSLTGSEAAFGISTRNGIELAIEEANAAGGVKGKKLQVRVYDDQSKPEEAGNAATRLVTQDKVVAILGEVASSNSLAMAPKAQAAQVPMVSPSSTNPRVTEVGDYIFRVCFIDPFQGAVMARYSREKLKFNNVAILTDKKSAYSEGLTEVFKTKFAEAGGKIVGIEAYSKGDTDFRAQLTNIKKLKPEGLYVPGYYQDVALIAEQARELGIKTVMMGGDGWDSEKLFELGGTAVEGSYVSNHYSSDDPSPRVQDFIKRYEAKFKAKPDSLAALGYDSAGVVIEALKRAPDSSGPALRDAIAQTKDYPGVAGTITLDAQRNPVKPAVVLKVEGGKFKYVDTVSP